MRLQTRHRKTICPLIALSVLTLFLPSWGWANCIQSTPVLASSMFYDATNSLNLTGYASVSGRTDYPGMFKCSVPAWGIIGGKNTVDNSTPYSNNTLYLKFPGNAYVSLNVSNLAPQVTHPSVGTNGGATIDASFTVNLALMKTTPTQNVMVVNGDTALINPIVLAQDSTGLTILQNITRLIADFAYFIFNWHWPTHDYDIYYKPLQIKFVKRVTTCSFDDQNKTVVLDDISLSELSNGTINGKKSFTLNFTCSGMMNGAATRNILAFMSSIFLQGSDDSTLFSPVAGSAGGVGIRIAKASDNIPIKFSISPTAQGNATPLFSYHSNQPLDQKLSIPMNAWYYIYDRNALSSGGVRTGAVVNLVYD